MRWLIDSDIWIEGERGNPAFEAFLASWESGRDAYATLDAVRGEFLLGVHAVADAAKRRRGEKFYTDRLARVESMSSVPEDFADAARMAGEARRTGKGKPGLVDGLLAAAALRLGASVATQNVGDFRAMGCPCDNPLEKPS